MWSQVKDHGFWLGVSPVWVTWIHFPLSYILIILVLACLDKESTCNAEDPGSIPESRRSAREGMGYPLQYFGASLMAQLVKNPPAMRETWVWSLGWEDPPEKGKAAHCSILAWRLYSPWGCKELDTAERLSLASLVSSPDRKLSEDRMHSCFIGVTPVPSIVPDMS